MKKIIYPAFWFLAFSLAAGSTQALEAIQFKLVLPKPEFVLPSFTGVYSEREAALAPEEYEMAEEFRVMLGEGKYQEVMTRLEPYYDIELSPAMLNLKAQVYFALKRYDKAEATYKAILQRRPQIIRVNSDLGQLYLIQGDVKQARQYFAKAVAYGASDAYVHGQLAYLNMQEFGAFSAVAEYERAIALEPDNPQWRQGLLAALSQAQMFAAADALLSELLVRNPKEPSLWMYKATISLELNRNKEALAALEMAILLGENNSQNLANAAQMHLQIGSYSRATELLQQQFSNEQLSLESAGKFIRWLGQANQWDASSKLLNGIEARVKGLSSDKQSRFHMLRAEVDVGRKQQSQALKNFNLALELDPANAEALLGYARLLLQQKNFTKADMLFSRAEGVSGYDKQALLGRAQLYIEMRDFKAALNVLRTVFTRYPDDLRVREKMDVIESIISTEEAKNSV